ncbi:hypothetical protein DFQ28_008297 [Apophysomyces sp. BC1034]|nr:hypothetical protein DFQ30_007155 [Apophysomyces sp. BC1015]KAG0181905.1 hypothetical protein DFQ29_006571 [Apophysomyces sp. BC1021]KAG0192674.1 hypothetical protein DFQ28_008297 [Apophysomyces sp. BC1034]
MTVIESNNRHAAHNRQALEQFKTLAASLDGWDFSTERDGVKLYSKTVPGATIPIVRGDIIFKTTDYTVKDVASVATLPGCRKIWDEKYDVSEVKELFTVYESLFWVKLKAPWPVSSRDFAATSLRDINDDECYVVMSSVEDSQIPPVSGCVRGDLKISGWKIYQVEGGVGVTYITQVDLAGSIPSSFLKNVQLQVPLCAGKVVEYIKKHGFPPTTLTCTAVYKSESFNHDKREHVVEVDGQGEVSWLVSGTMYPNGVKVNVSGQGQPEIVDEGKNRKVILRNVNGPATLKITKA